MPALIADARGGGKAGAEICPRWIAALRAFNLPEERTSA
jgi:hypothetical protein